MLAVAGLPPIPDAATDEQIEAARAVLVDHAESMTRAGVAITVSDWVALSALERGCWLVAKRRVEILAIIEEQQAGGDELAAAALYAEVDGGEQHDEILQDRAMRNAMHAMDGGA